MHTQQRSVHAHHQQEAVAYACAELQSFSRALWYSAYYTITFAKQNDIVLVGDNTELPVLVCAYSAIDPNHIHFHTEPKSSIKGHRCYWDRLQVTQAFGKYINKHVLIAHAISCDTHI